MSVDDFSLFTCVIFLNYENKIFLIFSKFYKKVPKMAISGYLEMTSIEWT